MLKSKIMKKIDPKYKCLKCDFVFTVPFPNTEKEIINPSCEKCNHQYVKWINFEEYRKQNFDD